MLKSFSIKHLESLSITPIRFSPDGPIVSQAHIHARRAELLPARRASIKEDALAASFIFTGFISAVTALAVALDFKGDDLTWFLMLVIGVMAIYMSYRFSELSRIKERLQEEFNALAPLESARCIELLRICKADAEVDCYRRRVIAERAFTQGECEMLVDHASRAEERAACKELYEVAA